MIVCLRNTDSNFVCVKKYSGIFIWTNEKKIAMYLAVLANHSEGTMSSSPILDVIIGLFSIYLGLSALVTTVNEHIATLFHWRAKDLESGIKRILHCSTSTELDTLVSEFYKLPQIQSLASDPQKKPSYIASETFVQAILDKCTKDKTRASRTLADIRQGIADLPEGNFKNCLISLAMDANQDLDKFKVAVGAWFDDCMDRVSGWYKRNLQVLGVVVGGIVVVLFNADSLELIQKLQASPGVFASYEHSLPTEAGTPSASDINLAAKSFVDKSTLVPGITNAGFASIGDFFSHLVGWSITILAVSLGAPFWFDLLSTFMSLRGAGPPPTTTNKSN